MFDLPAVIDNTSLDITHVLYFKTTSSLEDIIAS